MVLLPDARADRDGYMDFAGQQTAYEEVTGDRPEFVGFDRRFAAWCETHPRTSLAQADCASKSERQTTQ